MSQRARLLIQLEDLLWMHRDMRHPANVEASARRIGEKIAQILSS